MKKQAMETKKSARQSGFTLIELMAALAIAAAMYFGSVAVGTQAHGSGGGAGVSLGSALGQ